MNAHRRTIALASLTFLIAHFAYPQQNIPIGTFRLHVSYNRIFDIAFDGLSRTVAAAPHGVLIADRVNLELTAYSRADGLRGGTVTSIEFDPATRALFIAYEEGYFELLDAAQRITFFDPTATAKLSGSRRINDVSIAGALAYLSTDYGVVVFDLPRGQVRETWRDLGATGDALPVRHCVVRDDSVFAATTQGVMAGRLSDNLQDFNNWKRYMLWPFGGNISGLAVWNGDVFAAVDDAGVFRLVNGQWEPVAGVPVEKYFALQASAGYLILTAASGVYRQAADGVITQVATPLSQLARFAIMDENGSMWIGDEVAGIVTDASGSFISLLPECPANDVPVNVYYADGKVFAVGGGYDETRMPQHNRGVVDIHEQGRWHARPMSSSDLTDVVWDESSQTLFASSFGYGVEMRVGDAEATVFDETNSTLVNAQPPGRRVEVTALVKAANGVLALNHGVKPELHLLSRSDQGSSYQWKSFDVPAASSMSGIRMAIDGADNVWIAPDPRAGGGVIVFNPETGMVRSLTDAAGQGGLPAMSVLSLCTDREGAMWVGTANGVAYFPNAGAILQAPVDAIRPIVDGRFLLRDDAVTAIAVDGGNRKWFGTQRGAWLYNPQGDVPIGHFTASTSPIPSDQILDIDINQRSGEVFIATSKGLASYRAGATEPDPVASHVKIFPNPVPAGFSGTVGISGTPGDAVVKITDVAGRLVRQTRANGGTATWDLFDERGRRVPTGVYVVFTVSDDGEQREVAKLAVIN